MLHDPYVELAEQVNRDFPESWVPKQANDMIVGGFERLEEAQTSHGPCKVVILKTQDGVEKGAWLLHHVLRGEFKRVKPKVGELVAIRYLGMKISASRNDYASYRVAVRRDEAEPDWDALDATEESGDIAW